MAPHLFKPSGGRSEHWFLALRDGQRWLHATTQQAYMRGEPGSAWNVARCLLEDARLLHVIGERFVVVCGFTECLNVTHWQPTQPVTFPAQTNDDRRAPITSLQQAIDGRWHPYSGDHRVIGERVFTASIKEAPHTHVVRVLPVETDTSALVFRTACGIAPDPAYVFVRGVQADCTRCIR